MRIGALRDLIVSCNSIRGPVTYVAESNRKNYAFVVGTFRFIYGVFMRNVSF